MTSILNQFPDKINGMLSFFDRMIINGHILPFFSPSGKGYYLSQVNVLVKDFSAYAQNITDSLVSHVQNYAAGLGRPVIYLPSAKISKEQKAREVLEQAPIDEGLICVLSTVEYCTTLQPKKQEDGKLALESVNRKCKYYYFYFLDHEFGFMFVKLQTWFPFQIQVYINGREWLKHVFDENGITYRMYDNSFTEISDIPKAQELADAFDSKKLCRQLDHFARILNPYLTTLEQVFGQGYHWCADQCEYATDVMFKNREFLEDIYPSLVEHAFYDFSCKDVFTFMGRRLTNKFQGEAVSDYKERPVGCRIKFRMKKNSIKMYDKSSVLRIEMTINDPKEFLVYKDVHHRDGTVSKRWAPMGKSISYLYRYAEISKAANLRLLSALVNIIPKKSVEAEINKICEKKEDGERTFTGFNVWEAKTFFLFTKISDGRYLIKGFTNKDIRIIFNSDMKDRQNTSRTTRLFRKLRAHGLVRKVPHTHRYHLTDKGHRVLGALIETKKRTYPNLAVS